MRKHGWQLPYHPLQVVAIAVFLALGFAFYVFFVPFLGRKVFQYVAMVLYTPLVTCVVMLYIWCAAANPGDPGIFKSTKSLKLDKDGKHSELNSDHGLNHGGKTLSGDCSDVDNSEKLSRMFERNSPQSRARSSEVLCLICHPFSCLCKKFFHSDGQHAEQHVSEEGMFFCSLCEAEVLKNSKHCRVCDKCVDGFDHHCRWLNNCIGKRNYKGFFILMASAVLLLVMQWLLGVIVLTLFTVKRGEFSEQITSKLGSSFSTVAFVIVVATCTILAMIATVPLVQLLCFHVLLVKKGISTYDYIIALREQEDQQEATGHQSPQMSIISSATGFSTTSSFGPLHRGSWCTPPRLFLEDQFDVIPPEIGMSQNSRSKKTKEEEATKRSGTVKISPWTLARLNAEEVSKAAALAKKKSKILKPIGKHDVPIGHETDNGGKRVPKPDYKRRHENRGRFIAELSLDPVASLSASDTEGNPGTLGPLQLEARNAFQPRTATSTRIGPSSPESSYGSPDLHPLNASSFTAYEMQGALPDPASESAAQNGIEFTRSSSDGYEASGGEDSDHIPSRIVHRSSNWASATLYSGQGVAADMSMPSSGWSSRPN